MNQVINFCRFFSFFLLAYPLMGTASIESTDSDFKEEISANSTEESGRKNHYFFEKERITFLKEGLKDHIKINLKSALMNREEHFEVIDEYTFDVKTNNLLDDEILFQFYKHLADTLDQEKKAFINLSKRPLFLPKGIMITPFLNKSLKISSIGENKIFLSYHRENFINKGGIFKLSKQEFIKEVFQEPIQFYRSIARIKYVKGSIKNYIKMLIPDLIYVNYETHCMLIDELKLNINHSSGNNCFIEAYEKLGDTVLEKQKEFLRFCSDFRNKQNLFEEMNKFFKPFIHDFFTIQSIDLEKNLIVISNKFVNTAFEKRLEWTMEEFQDYLFKKPSNRYYLTAQILSLL